MCGIAGQLDLRARASRETLQAVAEDMAGALRHRGPDDHGVWVDAEAGIALGHRRLSILDLSPNGHQPMLSPSRRYVISYNGEIYNFRQLRADLEPRLSAAGLGFTGQSDTEVMLAAFEAWGIEEALRRFDGMFALALWDREARALYLARDRFGEKPLYYGRLESCFVFASELKAVRAHPEFRGDIDADALALYLRYNCIPAPHSIYRNLRKLPPATLLTLKAGQETLSPYWSLAEAAARGLAEPFTGSDSEAIEELHRLLLASVKARMVSDVPLGAFLSGGIDSSLIVALMQAQSARPVRTFSIGSQDRNYNEAGHARPVARHLGTEHTELYVTPEEAMAVIPRLPAIYDEPFADSSQIPTFLLSQMTRRHVTVSLSGDGGDEIFGGYNRYTWTPRIWNRVGWLPAFSRRLVGSFLTAVPAGRWDRLFATAARMLSRDYLQAMPGYKLHKLGDVLGADSPRDIYFRVASHWASPETMVAGSNPEVVGTAAIASTWPEFPAFEQRAMYLDTLTYLPNDILVKLDRASMAVSLEGRVPYLDHDVAEFSWRLPLSMKIRGSEGKWILRRVLYRYVPRDLVDRPKMGFGIPLGSWLRGALRDWAENLLDPQRLREDGFFHVPEIRRKWDELISGSRDWQYHIWDVLMFQAWWAENRKAAHRGLVPVPVGT